MNTEQLRWAKRFKWISLLEGLSFLILLGIAMPLKYVFDMPLAVRYVGWVHGLLFIIYIYAVFPTARSLKWEFGGHSLPYSHPFHPLAHLFLIEISEKINKLIFSNGLDQ